MSCTTLPGTKLLPVTVIVRAALPLPGTLAGLSEMVPGAGLLMVRVAAGEVPPPGVGFVMVMLRVEADA